MQHKGRTVLGLVGLIAWLSRAGCGLCGAGRLREVTGRWLRNPGRCTVAWPDQIGKVWEIAGYLLRTRPAGPFEGGTTRRGT